MSSSPAWDLWFRSLAEETRNELRKTVRLMVGAMSALFDQHEAAERDAQSDAEESLKPREERG